MTLRNIFISHQSEISCIHGLKTEDVIFHFFSPLSNLTPSHVAHLRLLVSLIDEELNEYLYDANVAGISGTYAGSDMGLLVRVL